MNLSEHPSRDPAMEQTVDKTSLAKTEEQASQSVPALWDPQLTLQLRALLHANPLLNLQYRDDRRPPELQHYSSLSLALKVFDLDRKSTCLNSSHTVISYAVFCLKKKKKKNHAKTCEVE